VKILINLHEEVFDEDNLFEGLSNMLFMVLVRLELFK